MIINGILVISAIIPVAVLMIVIYKLDKLEKESPGFLVKLGLMGVAATALASFTERIGFRMLDMMFEENTLIYAIIENFIIVAISEEVFKYLLLKSQTWKSPHFNCQFDGIVFAVFVSLGFALWENIMYVTDYGFHTALVRAVTAVPGHACNGAFMGAWYGLAKKYDNLGDESRSKTCRVLALVFPIILHGIYDFLASVDNTYYSIFFTGFVIAMFLVTIIMVLRLSKKDKYIV